MHWLSVPSLRRRWMLGYLIFNVALYSVQLVMYGALFAVEVDCTAQQLFERVISYFVMFIDVVVPCVVLAVWVYFSLAYAGFPYRSTASRVAASKMSRAVAFWCVGRVIIAVVSFTRTAIPGVGTGWAENVSPTISSAITVAVSVVGEVTPILLSLDINITRIFEGASQVEFDGITVEGSGRVCSSKSQSGEEAIQ